MKRLSATLRERWIDATNLDASICLPKFRRTPVTANLKELEYGG